MATQISTLNPQKLWQWFDVICSIPHASYHEEALATYIVNWARSKNLKAFRDEVGNVFVIKPASVGMEKCSPIALQSHLDMVTQANEDYDFINNPICPVIDGEWVKASGTTLGADNGIGMASMLAVLDSDDLAHPMIEALFTMTEETGMEGAFGLMGDVLQSRLMINTDTEQAGDIYLGCAGGVDVDIELSFIPQNYTNKTALKITLSGLKGGHSGLDIHKNNANAIILLANVLSQIEGVSLVNIEGGTARNAIPRAANAVILVDNKEAAIAQINTHCQGVLTLIGDYENKFVWQIEVLDDGLAQLSLTPKDSQIIINLINALPNGVIRNSDKVADTVETSSSLGKIKLDNGNLSITCLVRSLNEFGKKTACIAITSVCQLAGAGLTYSGSYVGWNPNPNSPITALTQQIYRQVIYGEPAFKVIHAGLECGLIQNAYPEMDIVSIGPTIKNAHSPDECVHIDSVGIYWQVLTGILANAPLKNA